MKNKNKNFIAKTKSVFLIFKHFDILAIKLLFLAFVLTLSACYEKKETNQTNKKPTIKIGLNLPLTGNMAEHGTKAMNAAILALKERSEKQKLKNNYELLFENDMLELKNVPRILNKFVNIDKVDAMVSIIGGKIIAPVADENKIPHFAVNIDASLAKNYKYTFNHWPQPESYGKTLVEYLESKKLYKITILAENNDNFVAIRKGLYKEIKESKVAILNEQYFLPTELFFRPILEKQKTYHPDAFIIFGNPPAIDLIAKTAKVLNISNKLIGIDSFNYSKNIDLFENSIFLSVDQGDEKFIQSFKKEFGTGIGHGTRYVYDIINLIIEGYENKEEHNDITEVIIEKNYSFSSPIYVSNNKVILSSPTMKKIKSGKAVLLEK